MPSIKSSLPSRKRKPASGLNDTTAPITAPISGSITRFITAPADRAAGGGSAAKAGAARRAAAKAVPKPYHHGSLRESLLLAAESLLADRGAQAVSLRDVAKSAGVSHAAPYHHFAGLNELLAAVAQRGFAQLGDAMAAAAGGADARENLLAICEAYVAFALSQAAQFRLMFGPLLARKHEYPELRESAERSFGVLMQAAQAYDPGGGALLGLSGWSLAHGLANLAIDGAFDALPIPSAPPRALARLMAERLLPAMTLQAVAPQAVAPQSVAAREVAPRSRARPKAVTRT